MLPASARPPIPSQPPGSESPQPGSESGSAPEQLSFGLEAAVVRFGALVRRVAWRHRLNGDDLDEVLQDVRVRLWRAHGQSEQLATVSASYVYRTAMSAALDLLRRRRRASTVSAGSHDTTADSDTTVDDVGANAEGGSNPEAALEASETSRAVLVAIERIPKSRRAVVRMYLMGHPPMEIAGLMGWTEPKTRNLLYRGLADLREELTSMGYGPSGEVAS
jgi:RNA polymerase sigma factor (sigma-70 family)